MKRLWHSNIEAVLLHTCEGKYRIVICVGGNLDGGLPDLFVIIMAVIMKHNHKRDQVCSNVCEGKYVWAPQRQESFSAPTMLTVVGAQ